MSRLPLRLVAPLAALVLVPAAALAGCSGDEDGNGEDAATGAGSSSAPSDSAAATASPSAATDVPELPEMPVCAEVWVAGATLPEDYAGCVEDSGRVSDDYRVCSIGYYLSTWDRFYAVPGEVVNEATPDLAGDPAFDKVVRACTG